MLKLIVRPMKWCICAITCSRRLRNGNNQQATTPTITHEMAIRTPSHDIGGWYAVNVYPLGLIRTHAEISPWGMHEYIHTHVRTYYYLQPLIRLRQTVQRFSPCTRTRNNKRTHTYTGAWRLVLPLETSGTLGTRDIHNAPVGVCTLVYPRVQNYVDVTRDHTWNYVDVCKCTYVNLRTRTCDPAHSGRYLKIYL